MRVDVVEALPVRVRGAGRADEPARTKASFRDGLRVCVERGEVPVAVEHDVVPILGKLREEPSRVVKAERVLVRRHGVLPSAAGFRQHMMVHGEHV